MLTHLSVRQAQRLRPVERSRRAGYAFVVLAGLLCFVAAASAEDSRPEQEVEFDIPQQRADMSLTLFAEQANLTLIVPFELARNVTTNRLQGSYNVADGIEILLAGTVLKPEFSDQGLLTNVTDKSSVPGGEPMVTKRRSLLAGIAAILAGGTAPAVAQEGVLEEIVVTGIRSSLQSSAEAKRNAVQVVDTITSEDVGKFPSENVAEAVQRITGVQITRTRGEGTGASIRGLPTAFTRVQLNNNTVASGVIDLRGGGSGGAIDRSFDFRLLPSEFVRTLEVVKSPSAKMQEGGLAGTINVITARPSELGGRRVVASAFAALDSNSGETTPRVSALYSDTFANDRFGILLTGAYMDSKPETHAVNTSSWATQPESVRSVDYNSDGDLADTINVPTQIRTEIARENRKRLAVAGVLEFSPSDTTTAYIEGFHSERGLVSRSLENIFLFNNATGPVFNADDSVIRVINGIDPTLQAAGVPYATSLGLTDVDVRGNDRINDSTAKTTFLKGGVEFKAELWSGEALLSHSRSKQFGGNLNLAQIQRFQVFYSCVPGEDICGLDLSDETASRFLDPDQGIVASLNGAFERTIQDENFEGQIDLARELDGSLINRVAFGALASSRDVKSDSPFLVVPGPALAPVVGLQPTTVQAAGFGIQPFSQVASPGSGSFLGAYDGRQPFPSQYLATNTLALLGAATRQELLAAGFIIPARSSDVIVGEDTIAGYIQADFASSDERISGNFGVRIVRTETKATGVAPDLTQISALVDAGGTIQVPPAEDVSATNSYTELLPSANLRIEVNDEFQLRFAASRTLSRPSLTQLSPATALAGVGGNFTLTAGNPELDPFISLNFDASAEWYPSDDLTVTLAVFHKELATLVRPTTDVIVLPVTFITESTNKTEVLDTPFNRTRPDNQRGVELNGFELGYQHFYSNLPGWLSNLGVQANYTFIENSDVNVLTAASKNNFNLSAFYEAERLGVRFSYTWRDEFVSVGLPDGNGGLGERIQPRGVLDASVSWQLTDKVSVVFEGINLLENADRARTILGDLPVDFFDPGRRIMLGGRIVF